MQSLKLLFSFIVVLLEFRCLFGGLSENSEIIYDDNNIKVYPLNGQNQVEANFDSEDQSLHIDSTGSGVEDKQDFLAEPDPQHSSQNHQLDLVVEDNATLLNNNDSLQSLENQKNESAKGTVNSGKLKKVTCLKRNQSLDTPLTVEVLNSSLLPSSFQTFPNATVAQCVLLLFYAPWCHFCAAAAPYFNAAPRVFPDILFIAVNAAVYSSLNARYGTLAIPTLLLFHNGQPVAKFNDSLYALDKFSEFVKTYTGLEPNGIINVTSADFEGPLPSTVSQEPDYFLWLAWTFLVSCCFYGFLKSSICHRIIETLRNNWQEAEAQHEHAD